MVTKRDIEQPCIDSEELAALIAGGLNDPARRRAMTHLDQCENCRLLFADAVRTLDALEALDEATLRSSPAPGRHGRPTLPAKPLKYAAWGGFAAAALLALVFGLGLLDLRSDHWERAQWWLDRYDVKNAPGGAREIRVDEERAQKVFSRIAAAAEFEDRPRLLILNAKIGPFALALQDHTILLSRQGLALCYDGATAAQGDSRLALVLGHELAHLHREEYFHAYAATRRSAATDARAVSALTKRFDHLKQRELAADRRGLLYAALAGFHPKALLEGQEAFISAWSAQTPVAAAHADHPAPPRRAAVLIQEWRDISAEIDVFLFGVRSYDLGRLDQALALFERFRQRFPSREAANNLGLVHFQRAAQILAQCNGELATRFMWPTALDRQTLVGGANFRGPPEDPCRESDDFQGEIQQALALFQEAHDKDPRYFPAGLNKISTLLLADDTLAAINAGQTLAEQGFQDSRLEAANVLALYLFASESEPARAHAIKGLRDHRERNPLDRAAVFNLAAALGESGKQAEARQVWLDFLELEPRGPYAAIARKKLGRPPAEAARSRSAAPSPPIPLGPIAAETRATLERASLRSVGGQTAAALYIAADFKALAWRDAIVLIQAPPPGSLDLNELEGRYGPEDYRVDTPAGSIRYYAEFAAEIEDGRLGWLWFFSS